MGESGKKFLGAHNCGSRISEIQKSYFFLRRKREQPLNMRQVESGLLQCFCKDVHKMAFDLNATLGPIIDSVVNLMPSFLNLVVAIVPVIITIAVVKFVVTFLDQIIALLKF